MENYLISIPDSKKNFFISLIEELKFAKIKYKYSQEEEKEYVEAINKSEDDIVKGKIINHSDLKKEILLWK
ncbi:MAG: hypothetical protein K8R54_13810 [Bacteroidales bacterium]|nr:hypothetical protein [Bacteroidales bacterium]